VDLWVGDERETKYGSSEAPEPFVVKYEVMLAPGLVKGVISE